GHSRAMVVLRVVVVASWHDAGTPLRTGCGLRRAAARGRRRRAAHAGRRRGIGAAGGPAARVPRALVLVAPPAPRPRRGGLPRHRAGHARLWPNRPAAPGGGLR